MLAPPAYALSQMYTQLLGRDVTFMQVSKLIPVAVPSLYGTYCCMPSEAVMLIKADLPLMASFGGLLVGLPEQIAQARMEQSPMDEVLQDAIHEVLNITSTPLSVNGRVVFQTLHLNRPELCPAAQDLLSPGHPTAIFSVTIKGYTGGQFQVMMPC